MAKKRGIPRKRPIPKTAGGNIKLMGLRWKRYLRGNWK